MGDESLMLPLDPPLGSIYFRRLVNDFLLLPFLVQFNN